MEAAGIYATARLVRPVRAVLLAIVLLAGCAKPPESATVDVPVGTEHAVCPPVNSRAIAVPFRVEATNDTLGFDAGIYRIDARTFLWVWANYSDTLREDRITRVNNVEVARDAGEIVHVCTRVDVATPVLVDLEPRSYGVAARIGAEEDLPAGAVRVTVNWVAGCPCDPLPRGNHSVLFEP